MNQSNSETQCSPISVPGEKFNCVKSHSWVNLSKVIVKYLNAIIVVLNQYCYSYYNKILVYILI